MTHDLAVCSGTGCNAAPVGIHQELKEVPAWRHPVDYKGQRAFEVISNIPYCAEHRSAAKAVPTSVLVR
jgi:hypothetical protein